MCEARYRPSSTSRHRSPLRCSTSVGTRTDGSTLRMSISAFISVRATAAPGLAPIRRYVAHQLRNAASCGQRRRALVDADRSAPLVEQPPAERVALLARRAPRVVVVAQPAGVAADHDERLGALRVGGREERAHRSALRHAEQHGALGARGLHHRAHVVHALLERRELVDRHRIGETGAALVEEDQPRHRREPREEAREQRLVPEPFEVRDPAHDEDQVDRTRAHDLIGDVDVAAARVADPWSGRRRRRRGPPARSVRHQPIPAAMRGFDVARGRSGVAQGLADLADRDLEHGVADVHAGPDAVEQFLLGEQASWLRGELQQHAEGLRRQRHDRGAAVQMAADRVQPERSERHRRPRYPTFTGV